MPAPAPPTLTASSSVPAGVAALGVGLTPGDDVGVLDTRSRKAISAFGADVEAVIAVLTREAPTTSGRRPGELSEAITSNAKNKNDRPVNGKRAKAYAAGATTAVDGEPVAPAAPAPPPRVNPAPPPAPPPSPPAPPP